MRLKARFLVRLVVVFWFTSGGVGFASGQARWVPIDQEYQTPSLHTVYFDPDSIHREGNLAVLWQLTDYKWMQGNAGFGRFGLGPHRFLSTQTRKQFDCEDKRVRLLAFTEYSHHMGTGRPADGYVDQSQWLPIEPAGLNEGLWKIACSQR